MSELRPNWETRITETAAHLAYPPTPDLRADVVARVRRGDHAPAQPRARRLAWALSALLLVLVGLWAVPPVRATVRDTVEQLWQIGAIRLRLVEPTMEPTAEPTPAAAPRSLSQPTLQPTPQPTPLPIYPPLAGETTLAAARAQVDFPIRLPTGSIEAAGGVSVLGPPDAVYVQQMGGPVVILVWMQPDDQAVQMSLTIFGPDTFAEKSLMAHTLLQETTVHDTPALWMQGEHVIQFKDGSRQATQLVVAGNVLIWSEKRDATPAAGSLTYRLESNLSLDDAVRVAESLR